MPMGWGGDMDDVCARLMDQLAPVVVGLHVDLQLCLRCVDSTLQVLLVDVAYGQQTVSIRV